GRASQCDNGVGCGAPKRYSDRGCRGKRRCSKEVCDILEPPASHVSHTHAKANLSHTTAPRRMPRISPSAFDPTTTTVFYMKITAPLPRPLVLALLVLTSSAAFTLAQDIQVPDPGLNAAIR